MIELDDWMRHLDFREDAENARLRQLSEEGACRLFSTPHEQAAAATKP